MLGSEGRGEQILKTDQDNALILPEGLTWPTQTADLVEFSALLERLGFEREGFAREYLMINGRWEDHILTSLINPAP